MDHMMPEMDGIEATAAIRAWEQAQEKQEIIRFGLPIIALTANAVSGMREMFLEKGFNDFLAKPIDILKLDEALDRWIPNEKKEQGIGNGEWGMGSSNRNSNSSGTTQNQYFNSNNDPLLPTPHSLYIPGVDTAKGIAMTGGTEALYCRVLSLFRKDAEDRLPLLHTIPGTDTLTTFVTQVHALKSASASIGAAKVSALAAALEAAGKTGDMALIREKQPGFAEQLTELIENIRAALESKEAENPHSPVHISNSEYLPLLNELAAALETKNAAAIDRISNDLTQKPLDPKIKETIEQISDHILMTEFDSALTMLRTMLRTIPGEK
jgi:CheY-like chemotaxis protein